MDQRPEFKSWEHEIARKKYIREGLQDFGISDEFLDKTPKTKQQKAKTDKSDMSNSKRFYTAKKKKQSIKKKHVTELKKIFASYSSNKVLIAMI